MTRMCIGASVTGALTDSLSWSTVAGVARFVDPVVLSELLAHLLDSDEKEQRSCRAAIPEQEARFVARMRGLQDTIGAIVADETRETRNETMKRAQALHESERNRMTHVESLIRSSFHQVGLTAPEPLPARLVERVRKGCAGLLEFEHQIYRKVGHTRVNVDKEKMGNAVWDRLIAFNIGQSIGHWPLLLIAEDGVFAEVARAAGHGDRVATLAAYEQWLTS